jgi:hypothetical protein
MTVDLWFSHSTDGGTTWSPSTAAGGGANPILGAPIGVPTTFTWDSRGDGVGTAMVTATLVKVEVEDSVSLVPGECQTGSFDVDNTSLCPGMCGDCNLDAAVTILDALVAAQISAGLLVPTQAQQGCCDVDSSMNIAIIDALLIAQDAAGLVVTLMCP